jgi:hypothetical protein
MVVVLEEDILEIRITINTPQQDSHTFLATVQTQAVREDLVVVLLTHIREDLG